MLNVSIGKVKYVDLNNQRNNREQTIGIDKLVIPNVKSQMDLWAWRRTSHCAATAFSTHWLARTNPVSTPSSSSDL